MRLYGLLGGRGQVRTCVQSVRQTRGVWGHAPLGNFDLDLLQFGGIWDCFHTHIIFLPFIVSLKLL